MEPNKGMFLRRISVELPSDIIQIHKQMLGLQYTPIKHIPHNKSLLINPSLIDLVIICNHKDTVS